MFYTSMISIVAFFCAVQLVTQYNVRAVWPSLVAVGVPYGVTVVISGILAATYHAPILENMFMSPLSIVAAVQFASALFIFQKIRDEDGFTATLAWAVGGFFLVLFLAPFVVYQLIR